MSFPTCYKPEPAHLQLGENFYDPVEAAKFSRAILRYRNDKWAKRVGLDELSNWDWIGHFGRFTPLPDNLEQPLALRYHGHQFRHYNPNLGDGRGFLFAQMRDCEDGRLLDLGTKGSGQTPWSRAGDGRLTLKGGVREIMATEMLEALGVNTSKTFSIIETGEALTRGDEPSPTRSAVMVRLNHSHIRFGTFQRLFATGKHDEIEKLVNYCVTYYWPELEEAGDKTAALFDRLVTACAELCADWHVAGFVHGVLNTDNISVTGESFDYGPWRFIPVHDPDFTAAYFDEYGLYSFGRQPEALHWNLAQLYKCLMPASPAPKQYFQDILEQFMPRFKEALTQKTYARLGLAQDQPGLPEDFVFYMYNVMRVTKAPYEQCFFDLVGCADQERLDASPSNHIYQKKPWQEVIQIIQQKAVPCAGLEKALSHPYAKHRHPCTMLIDEVEEIWSFIDKDDNWDVLEEKIEAIREMGEFYAVLRGDYNILQT